MSNIVPLRGSGEQQETTVLLAREAFFIVRALHDLEQAGKIGQGAFALGAQVVQKFQQYDCFKVALTIEEAANSFVARENGVVLAGRPFDTFSDGITALQELHFQAGILSHYHDAELEKEDSHKGHFSLDPMISAGIEFTAKTPIIFMFNPASMGRLAAKARDALIELRADYNERVLTVGI